MHQSIKMACALLDLLTHLIIDVHVEDIGHEIERVLVVLHFGVEPSQIEAVSEVILVNFAEVFISST